ncbi:MAG: NUDIX domain-containing protein [Actinomycetota bacterium]|nr:NUDIX domain-containing protein [Actinomycetota bacterium]
MTPARQIPCVGAVVLDGDGRLLLVRRANPPAQGLWSIPGGRVEEGESAEAAVVRELREETGLAGSVVREVGTVERDAPGGGVYVIRDFLLAVTGSPAPLAGDDASDAAWFTGNEVRALDTSPDLVDVLTGWGIL